MNKRVTIMIDGELDHKLRLLQARKIRKESRNVSYSKVLNDMVRAGLRR